VSHHVTYEPPVTAGLCEQHHRDITAINAHQARKQRSQLGNSQRWAIWYAFIRGTLKKPRVSRLDREWLAVSEGLAAPGSRPGPKHGR
jgi:hypothetical protein